MLNRTIAYFTQDIWQVRPNHLPRHKAIGYNFLRGIVMTIREFANDQCTRLASALTFYSLLSIVPVMAMAFGIAKGFGLRSYLEQRLRSEFPGQEQAFDYLISWANSLLENTQGGIITGIGAVFLLWSVLKILNHIEKSLNLIWKADRARPLGRKFSDYLSIMLIAPILFIISSSATLYITTQIRTITKQFELLGYFSPIIFFALKSAPYIVVWILFTFLYLIIPNVRVQFSSGLLAGVIAGTMFQVSQWLLITLQVGVSNYNTIYGSFSAFPLFLIWMNIGWIIVLLGAEIAYVHQHVNEYELEPDRLQTSFHLEKLLGLRISHFIICGFARGEDPVTAKRVAQKIDIPVSLTERILKDLVKARILNRNESDRIEKSTYQPARDIHDITIQFVLDSMEKNGLNQIPMTQDNKWEPFKKILQEIADTISRSQAGQLVKDI